MTRRASPAVVLAGALALVPAQIKAQTISGRISVLGRASIELVPDYVSVQVGVFSKAPSPTSALDENSATAARVIAFARQFGVGASDLKTTAVNLSPAFKTVRDPNGNTRQEPDGYNAANTVEVRLRDISRLGGFMRDVLNQGANRIHGVQFGATKRDEAAQEARKAAVADAMAKAEALAAAGGVKLGRIEQISSPPRGEVRPLATESAPRAAGMAVPIESGTLEVSAEVGITWILE